MEMSNSFIKNNFQKVIHNDIYWISFPDKSSIVIVYKKSLNESSLQLWSSISNRSQDIWDIFPDK